MKFVDCRHFVDLLGRMNGTAKASHVALPVVARDMIHIPGVIQLCAVAPREAALDMRKRDGERRGRDYKCCDSYRESNCGFAEIVGKDDRASEENYANGQHGRFGEVT